MCGVLRKQQNSKGLTLRGFCIPGFGAAVVVVVLISDLPSMVAEVIG